MKKKKYSEFAYVLKTLWMHSYKIIPWLHVAFVIYCRIFFWLWFQWMISFAEQPNRGSLTWEGDWVSIFLFCSIYFFMLSNPAEVSLEGEVGSAFFVVVVVFPNFNSCLNKCKVSKALKLFICTCKYLIALS